MKRGLLVLVAASIGACASNPARSSLQVPLVIPEPPPRVELSPIPAEEPPPPELPAPAPLPVAGPTPPPPRTPANTSAAPAAPATPMVTVPEPPPAPAPELRPAGAAVRGPSAAQVRESLVRTKQKLDALDRRQLTSGRRADYDSARRFLAQAESAVASNNLLLAQSSAEKAETLADGLR